MVSKTISTLSGNKINYKLIKDGYKTITNSIDVTGNMDENTTINLDAPSEIFEPDLDYTVDTSKECQPIITFNKNIMTPDGTEIEKGKYVFASYGQDYLMPTENTEDNFIRVGDVMVLPSGEVKKFNNTNRLQTNLLNFGTNDYEVVIGFNLTKNTNDYQMMMHSNEYYYFNICVTPDLHIHSNAGDSSNWYVGITGNTTLQLNTNYLVKVIRNSFVRYMYISSDNGQTWLEEGSVNDSYDYSQSFHIGITPNLTQIFSGSIDLSKTYVKINGEYAWKPIWNGFINNFITNGSVIYNNGVVNNFNSSNYINLLEPFNPNGNSWEVVMKVYPPETDYGYFFHSSIGANDSQRFGIAGIFYTNSNFVIQMSTNGSSWDISLDGQTTLSRDKFYWVKFGWTGTEYYLEYSENGETYTRDATLSSSIPVVSGLSVTHIGTYQAYQWSPFYGSIDLTQSYIKINNEIWWEYKLIESYLNFGIIGNPTLNYKSGVVTNLNKSNYLIIPKILEFNSNDKVEIFTRVLFSNTGAQFIMSNQNSEAFGTTGNVWKTYDGSNNHTGGTYNTNTVYDIRLLQENGNYRMYVRDVSNNGSEICEITVDGKQVFKSGDTLYIGMSIRWEYFQYGTLYLDNTYIKINDEMWWNPKIISGEILPGILVPELIDNGISHAYNLYDIQSSKRELLLSNDRNSIENSTISSDIKFSELSGQVTIPSHNVYEYKNNKWMLKD